MNLEEFSNHFDVFYNNVTSNQAPGLNEWEKSVFLTKAEKEIVKNHLNAKSKGNAVQEGFDDSSKRQADFSMLMKTVSCSTVEIGDDTSVVTYREYVCTDSTTSEVRTLTSGIELSQSVSEGTYTVIVLNDTSYITITNPRTEQPTNVYVTGWPFSNGGTLLIRNHTVTVNSNKIDNRSVVYAYPSDIYIPINETLMTSTGRILQITPLRYDEYTRLMLKPFKRPLKNQAWKLINSGYVEDGSYIKLVEIITNTWDEGNINSYKVRYVRTPKPIILAPMDGLSIDGYYGSDSNGEATRDSSSAVSGIECELDPMFHEEILQRAVELAKIAWQGDIAATTQSGQRSE